MDNFRCFSERRKSPISLNRGKIAPNKLFKLETRSIRSRKIT